VVGRCGSTGGVLCVVGAFGGSVWYCCGIAGVGYGVGTGLVGCIWGGYGKCWIGYVMVVLGCNGVGSVGWYGVYAL